MDDRKRCDKPNSHQPHWHKPDKDTPLQKWCDGKGNRHTS